MWGGEVNLPVRYFMPGQMVFFMEHPSEERASLDEGRVKDLLGRLLASELDLVEGARKSLDEAQVVPQRTVTFDQAGGRSFSLIAARAMRLEDRALLRFSNETNRSLQRGINPVEDFTLRAVSPNWLSSTLPPAWIVPGGPGVKPVPVEPAPGFTSLFEFEVGEPDIFAHSDGKVDVAILDSVPAEYALHEAYSHWHQDHTLIQDLLGPNGTLNIIRAEPYLLDELSDPANYPVIDGHDYEMSDHGLFVAGIVRCIAPKARLHLIQVLNDYGVGTLESLLAGLRKLRELRSGCDYPLIVNLSLMLSIPLEGQHHHPAHDADFGEYAVAGSNFADGMGRMIEIICRELDESDVTIVAAAGNDAKGKAHPVARYPAALESVLGVGALNPDFTAAVYSNRSDNPVKAGIATFGGRANGDEADQTEGMIGIYTGRFPDGTRSTNGWARWAGTSFAAPVISGALAARVAAHGNGAQAIQELRDASPGHAGESVVGEVFPARQQL